MDEINDKCNFEKYESVRVSCLRLNLVKNTLFLMDKIWNLDILIFLICDYILKELRIL